jgi:hypothetical protein
MVIKAAPTPTPACPRQVRDTTDPSDQHGSKPQLLTGTSPSAGRSGIESDRVFRIFRVPEDAMQQVRHLHETRSSERRGGNGTREKHKSKERTRQRQPPVPEPPCKPPGKPDLRLWPPSQRSRNRVYRLSIDTTSSPVFATPGYEGTTERDQRLSKRAFREGVERMGNRDVPSSCLPRYRSCYRGRRRGSCPDPSDWPG